MPEEHHVFCAPKDPAHNRTTKQFSAQSLPLWGHNPESRTLHVCPHRGAKRALAKILARPPHLLAGPTSAGAAGMPLSGAQVLSKW